MLDKADTTRGEMVIDKEPAKASLSARIIEVALASGFSLVVLSIFGVVATGIVVGALRLLRLI